MKILLVGEYSRLHNSLQEGMEELGHEVTLVATGDHFKKFPADIALDMKYHTGLMKYVKVGIYKLTGFDITSDSVRNQFLRNSEQLTRFDVVQLINESPFGLVPKTEKVLIDFLRKNNDKLFLLSCGTDYLSVKFALGDALPYSILQEYKDGNVPADRFKYTLKYTQPTFKSLHEFVYERIDGVIASDLDYHLPLKDHPSYLGLIPNPVNTDKLVVPQTSSPFPVKIFLGINRAAYHTKGIRYFEEALEIIQKKYTEKVEVQVVEDLPYDTYIKKYDQSHIILDQVLGQDQGYNALEAMAKEKVVFTGAEQVFYDHYDLKAPIAINAVPDVERIVSELESLILNPGRIDEIGKNAREFVSEHHDFKKVAQMYLDTWLKS